MKPRARNIFSCGMILLLLVMVNPANGQDGIMAGFWGFAHAHASPVVSSSQGIPNEGDAFPPDAFPPETVPFSHDTTGFKPDVAALPVFPADTGALPPDNAAFPPGAQGFQPDAAAFPADIAALMSDNAAFPPGAPPPGTAPVADPGVWHPDSNALSRDMPATSHLIDQPKVTHSGTIPKGLFDPSSQTVDSGSGRTDAGFKSDPVMKQDSFSLFPDSARGTVKPKQVALTSSFGTAAVITAGKKNHGGVVSKPTDTSHAGKSIDIGKDTPLGSNTGTDQFLGLDTIFGPGSHPLGPSTSIGEVNVISTGNVEPGIGAIIPDLGAEPNFAIEMPFGQGSSPNVGMEPRPFGTGQSSWNEPNFGREPDMMGPPPVQHVVKPQEPRIDAGRGLGSGTPFDQSSNFGMDPNLVPEHSFGTDPNNGMGPNFGAGPIFLGPAIEPIPEKPVKKPQQTQIDSSSNFGTVATIGDHFGSGPTFGRDPHFIDPPIGPSFGRPVNQPEPVNPISGAGMMPVKKPSKPAVLNPSVAASFLNELSGFSNVGKPTPPKKQPVIPDKWLQLYPSGRRPPRKTPAIPQSAVAVDPGVSETEKQMAEISNQSFGKHENLYRQLRKQRIKERKQRRKERKQRKERAKKERNGRKGTSRGQKQNRRKSSARGPKRASLSVPRRNSRRVRLVLRNPTNRRGRVRTKRGAVRRCTPFMQRRGRCSTGRRNIRTMRNRLTSRRRQGHPRQVGGRRNIGQLDSRGRGGILGRRQQVGGRSNIGQLTSRGRGGILGRSQQVTGGQRRFVRGRSIRPREGLLNQVRQVIGGRRGMRRLISGRTLGMQQGPSGIRRIQQPRRGGTAIRNRGTIFGGLRRIANPMHLEGRIDRAGIRLPHEVQNIVEPDLHSIPTIPGPIDPGYTDQRLPPAVKKVVDPHVMPKPTPMDSGYTDQRIPPAVKKVVDPIPTPMEPGYAGERLPPAVKKTVDTGLMQLPMSMDSGYAGERLPPAVKKTVDPGLMPISTPMDSGYAGERLPPTVKKVVDPGLKSMPTPMDSGYEGERLQPAVKKTVDTGLMQLPMSMDSGYAGERLPPAVKKTVDTGLMQLPMSMDSGYAGERLPPAVKKTVDTGLMQLPMSMDSGYAGERLPPAVKKTVDTGLMQLPMSMDSGYAGERLPPAVKKTVDTGLMQLPMSMDSGYAGERLPPAVKKTVDTGLMQLPMSMDSGYAGERLPPAVKKTVDPGLMPIPTHMHSGYAGERLPPTVKKVVDPGLKSMPTPMEPGYAGERLPPALVGLNVAPGSDRPLFLDRKATSLTDQLQMEARLNPGISSLTGGGDMSSFPMEPGSNNILLGDTMGSVLGEVGMKQGGKRQGRIDRQKRRRTKADKRRNRKKKQGTNEGGFSMQIPMEPGYKDQRLPPAVKNVDLPPFLDSQVGSLTDQLQMESGFNLGVPSVIESADTSLFPMETIYGNDGTPLLGDTMGSVLGEVGMEQGGKQQRRLDRQERRRKKAERRKNRKKQRANEGGNVKNNKKKNRAERRKGLRKGKAANMESVDLSGVIQQEPPPGTKLMVLTEGGTPQAVPTEEVINIPGLGIILGFK